MTATPHKGESGNSARTFKSAQIWMVADSSRQLREEAMKLLAWEDIKIDADDLHYDDSQKRQLEEHVKRAQRDLREAIWRAFKFIVLLDKKNELNITDLGLVTSSAGSPVDNVLARLQGDGDIEKGVSPNYLCRHWPPALPEWSTKGVRDAFFASPQFPRLLDPDVVRETVARGVSSGQLAYVGKRGDGLYDPFLFECPASMLDIEIAEDTYIISRETAQAYRESLTKGQSPEPAPPIPTAGSGESPDTGVKGGAPGDTSSVTPVQGDFFAKLTWTGAVPPQKWMNFYTKVLTKYASDRSLTLRVSFDASPESGISKEKVDETRSALRELGLDPNSLKAEQ